MQQLIILENASSNVATMTFVSHRKCKASVFLSNRIVRSIAHAVIAYGVCVAIGLFARPLG